MEIIQMKVRLKDDPASIGILTGESRQINGHTQKQVMFADGRTDYRYETALESIEEITTNPLELLAQGRLGRARDLRSHLTYIRLNGRLADLIYSMDTTNTDFYAYQFKPVLNFLESPSNGLLIADEVGLGKTIEAGLIWTELRSRFDARRLLVVCPAMLREKWQSELQQRFGIEATIADATELLKILKANKSHFAVVTSMQGLRPRKGWDDEKEAPQDNASKLAQFLKEMEHQEPLVDLLIIDEAHYLRNSESMTAKLGKLLRPITDYMVLLSATPINLKNEDLYQLLNLVDEETFNQPAVFSMILDANKPLIEARDQVLRHKLTQEEFKDFIEEAKWHPFLQNSHQLEDLLNNLPTDAQLRDDTFRSKLAHRLENINLLGRAISRTRKRDVQEWRVEREVTPEYIPLTEIEREFYDTVTSFLRRYCDGRHIPSGFILATPQRQISSSMPAALQAWRKRNRANLEEQLYEDIGDIEEFTEEVGEVVEQLIRLSNHFDLQELLDNDSKFERLQTLLRGYLERYPQEKVILFAYFRQTLFYLQERLAKAGIICEVLVGGTHDNKRRDKQQIINEFRENSQSKVLLLSEVGSEGIDLQFCRLLINYDLPWNPMKVEQRIGRIDRLGQKSPKIIVWNLFYEDTIDARIYQRLFARLEIFKYALGDLEEVLGQEIRQLTIDLLANQFTPEQEEKRIEQTRLALATKQQLEEKLEAEAVNLVAHGHYILNEVRAAKELNRLITDEDIWVFIRDFMQEHYRGCEFKQLKNNELVFDVRLSDQAKVEFDDFLRKKQLYGYTHLAINDPKPICCEFKNKVAGKVHRGQKETISQFHPLTRFVTAKIRERGVSFYPVVAVKLSVNYLPRLSTGYYVFYSQLWSLEGLRAIEKVYFSAKLLGAADQLSEQEAEQLITYAALYGKDWEEGKNIIDLTQARAAVEVFIDEAEEKYQSYSGQIQGENEDRATLQKGTLIAHRDKQLVIQEGVLNKHHEEIKSLTARGNFLAKVVEKVAEKESVIKELKEIKGKITSRESLIKATKGKMTKIESRVNYKLTEIENKKQLKSRNEELSLGLIYLT